MLRLALFAVLFLPPVPQSGLSAQEGTLLHGRWQPTRMNKSGLGDILEFTPAGQLIVIHGALIWTTFRTEGNRLIRQSPGLPDLTIRFTVRGDTMLQWPLPGPDSVRLVRTPESTSRTGIVGHWTYTHYTGATAYEDFRDDGTWRLSVPIQTDTATFRVRADTLITVGWPFGHIPGRYRWSYANGTLHLKLEGETGGADFVRFRDH